MSIVIQPSPTADTRTCDVSKVSREQLLKSSRLHIDDVRRGMRFFSDGMLLAGNTHDHDKLTGIDQFYVDFRTGFKQTIWLQRHYKLNRHHLDNPDGVPSGVNLIDVIEHVVDCVMAGMARSGEVRPFDLSSELLQRAVKNTVEMLLENTSVREASREIIL